MSTVTTLGLILLIVGALVAVVEAHYPTNGIAGGLGVAVMAIGAVLAISGLGAGVIVGLLGGLALAGVGGAGVALTVKHAAGVRHRRVRGGAEGLIGEIGGGPQLDRARRAACRCMAACGALVVRRATMTSRGSSRAVTGSWSSG